MLAIACVAFRGPFAILQSQHLSISDRIRRVKHSFAQITLLNLTSGAIRVNAADGWGRCNGQIDALFFRVNLFAVANEEFYTQLGFKPTEYTQNEDVLLELPTTTALRILKERGLIDG